MYSDPCLPENGTCDSVGLSIILALLSNRIFALRLLILLLCLDSEFCGSFLFF